MSDTEKTPANIALWQCDKCKIWWSSQLAEEQATWRLYRLSEPVPNPLLWKSDYPTWKVAGPTPSICPECGSKMMEQKVLASESATHF